MNRNESVSSPREGDGATAWKVTPKSLGCEFGSHYCKTHDLLISSCLEEAHERTTKRLVNERASLLARIEGLEGALKEISTWNHGTGKPNTADMVRDIWKAARAALDGGGK